MLRSCELWMSILSSLCDLHPLIFPNVIKHHFMFPSVGRDNYGKYVPGNFVVLVKTATVQFKKKQNENSPRNGRDDSASKNSLSLSVFIDDECLFLVIFYSNFSLYSSPFYKKVKYTIYIILARDEQRT